MSSKACVLDASVGVKWFRREKGSEAAAALLHEYKLERVLLVVDSLFFYEVLRAATRDRTPSDALRVWRDLALLDLVTVPMGDELVAAAVRSRERLGCSLYDAFSAGLADLLDAPLYSADERAHGAHPRVKLIG